jgi:hypothetical protein
MWLSVDRQGIHISRNKPEDITATDSVRSIPFRELTEVSFSDNRDGHYHGRSRGLWLDALFAGRKSNDRLAFTFKSYDEMMKFRAVLAVNRNQAEPESFQKLSS